MRVDDDDNYFINYYKKGVEILSKHKKIVTNSLEKYIVNSTELSATEIEKDWFPNVDADVFLSHSHMDEKFVISFAGWLYDKYGVVPFVDSCVWNYCNDLLRTIDDKYCVDRKNEEKYYNYERRNYSTSHVHMLLNGALAKMIDNTECLIFVNSPNSIKTEDVINKSTTGSPWIYSELLLSKIIRHKKLNKYRKDVLKENIAHSYNALQVNYDIELDHLYDLDINHLKNLEQNFTSIRSAYNLLDYLYTSTGIMQGEV